jgi:hypothetical protein
LNIFFFEGGDRRRAEFDTAAAGKEKQTVREKGNIDLNALKRSEISKFQIYEKIPVCEKAEVSRQLKFSSDLAARTFGSAMQKQSEAQRYKGDRERKKKKEGID